MTKTYKDLWKKCHHSVCSIKFLNGNDIEITSLSGFKAGGYIFANDLVNKIHKAEFVEIKFVKEDGHSIIASERFSLHDFTERIITTYDEEVTGFALLSIAETSFESVPSLTLASTWNHNIGQPVAVIGFQYDHNNLTLKSGILSSFVYHNNHRYLQFDGSIIWGNSGSPLIDIETFEVIGIIGYRLDGKYQAYEKMLEISNSNIKMLEAAQGEFNVAGVDPIQVLIAWQKQIKQLSGEIYKGLGMGMGIAMDIKSIKQLLKSSGIDVSLSGSTIHSS